MVAAVGNTNLHNQAVGAIRRLILSDHLRPEEKLPAEDKLAERLGYSRTVVREAIKFLSAKGLLEVRQGLGTFVREPDLTPSVADVSMLVAWDRSWLKELVELRAVIELGIAGMVISRVTDADTHRMTTAIMQARKRVEAGDQNIADEDCQFHLAYLSAAKNRAVESHGALLRRFFASSELPRVPATRETNEASIADHVEILNCILKQDEVALKAALRKHLEVRLRSIDQDN